LLANLWSVLKDIFLPPPVVTPSLGALARINGIDRRKFTRVKVPATTVNLFPRLRVQNSELPVIDLSIGGACVKDVQGIFQDKVGQEVALTLHWPTETEELKAKVISTSNQVNRHLQFSNLSPGSVARFGILVRSGAAGLKIRQTPSGRDTPVRLEAQELWTGMGGDNLVFFAHEKPLAQLTALTRTTQFFPGQTPRIALGPKGAETREALPHEIADALVCLANIPEPSTRLLRLIEFLCSRPDLWQVARSG
jgi:hypothetical protein